MRRFIREVIQAIVGSRNRGRHRPPRVLVLYLRQTIARIVSIGRGGAILEGGRPCDLSAPPR